VTDEEKPFRKVVLACPIVVPAKQGGTGNHANTTGPLDHAMIRDTGQQTPRINDEQYRAQARRRIFIQMFWVLGLIAIAEFITVLVLEVQASVTSYLVAESQWSKSQKRAVMALHRYVDQDRQNDLEQVREQLQTPMLDREARMLMDAEPNNIAGAKRLIAAAGHADPDRLVWMYRIFSRAPYFSDAVVAWKETDAPILRLAQLADEIESHRRAGTLTRSLETHFHNQLDEVEATTNPLSLDFAYWLAHGNTQIRWTLLAFTAMVYTLLAWLAVTSIAKLVQHVRSTESEFRLAFHQSTVGMLKIARDGRVRQANEAVTGILGVPIDELVGASLRDILHEDDVALDDHGQLDWDQLTGASERKLATRDGNVRWVRWTATRITNRHNDLFVLVEDVSENHQLTQEIAHQAMHDELTGLINRREIVRRLEQALAETRTGTTHVLCFIDLDKFKLVNDTCGHLAGDKYLQQFSNLLSAQLRKGDWLGRLGGDEFAVLLSGAKQAGGAAAMARMHAALANNVFQWEGRVFTFNCSVGIAEMNADSPDVEWALSAADAACYVAKQQGRHRVCTYDAANPVLTQHRSELEWVANVQSAIAESRLVPFAQRIVPLQGGDGLQYELLARVRDRQGKMHAPGGFIAAMERLGQASIVDRHMLDVALDFFRANPQHLAVLERCHINVSAQSIADPTFLSYAIERLDALPQVAAKLCFEITETAMIANLDDARRFIDAIHAKGCRIALDDFGNGLSSFAYLKTLPVDILKIDSMFVRNLDSDGDGMALVRSLSQIARALGKSTVAEGVESEEVARILASIGIDHAQGFALHQPEPLEVLVAATRAGANGHASHA